MIRSDELYYIAWTDLGRHHCEWLIEHAEDRLKDIAGKPAPLMDEERKLLEERRARQ